MQLRKSSADYAVNKKNIGSIILVFRASRRGRIQCSVLTVVHVKATTSSFAMPAAAIYSPRCKRQQCATSLRNSTEQTWVTEMFLSGGERETRKELERGINPEIKREKELKAGTITSSVGIGASLFSIRDHARGRWSPERFRTVVVRLRYVFPPGTRRLRGLRGDGGLRKPRFATFSIRPDISTVRTQIVVTALTHRTHSEAE